MRLSTSFVLSPARAPGNDESGGDGDARVVVQSSSTRPMTMPPAEEVAVLGDVPAVRHLAGSQPLPLSPIPVCLDVDAQRSVGEQRARRSRA
jgi:hypothetical protein